jgi:lipopolysaccharide transport system ATP-binding protein
MTQTNNKHGEQAILSLEHVGLCYSQKRRFFARSRTRFWALKDVSFNLYAGETLGIIGRNGVGKSTLLRIIAGIIAPNSGKVIVRLPGIRISLISVQAGFLPFLSGRENALLSGMLLGATKNEIVSHMEDIISFSELNEFFDEPLGTYSTGMRARLGFSVAYYINPDIILLDEVLGVGDQAFSIKSTEAMKKRIKSDKTVVLVSHNIPLVKEVCDRLLWIENGITMAQGNVSGVVKKYLDFVNS